MRRRRRPTRARPAGVAPIPRALPRFFGRRAIEIENLERHVRWLEERIAYLEGSDPPPRVDLMTWLSPRPLP